MKILVIEDDLGMAELIKLYLEQQGDEVTVIHKGEHGLELAKQADLAVIDVLLPGINGLDLCLAIKQERPQLPILMISVLDTTEDKLRGFTSGADDYLVKPCDLRELGARVKSLLRRQYSAESDAFSEALVYEDLRMDLSKKIVRRADQIISLTPKEYRLLEYLMRNTGRVITREELAEKVWETRFDTKTNFIDVYINYLRNKMDRGFPTKLIHTKSGMGFVFIREV